MEDLKKKLKLPKEEVTLEEVEEEGWKVIDMERNILEDKRELIFTAQLNKDRKLCPLNEECFAIKDGEIYRAVCSTNFKFCVSFIDNKPVSKEAYESGNYVVQVNKNGGMIAFSGKS